MFSLAVIVLGLVSAAIAQEEKRKGPELHPLFKDDFSKDTRKDYQIRGNVHWKPNGSLTLAPGALVARDLNAGCRVKIRCDIRFPTNDNDDAEFQTRQINFRLQGVAGFFVAWVRQTNDGRATYTLSVVEVHPGAMPSKRYRIVRRWQLPKLSPGIWQVSYRYGAILIAQPKITDKTGTTSFNAYTAKRDANVRAIAFEAATAPMVVGSLEVSGHRELLDAKTKKKRLVQTL